MTTATSEDTEITLGTGKMLLLFFGLVALCAVFFAMGFSIGRKSALSAPLADVSVATPTASAGSRPSAVKAAAMPTPTTVSASEKADASPAPSDQSATASTGNVAENGSDHGAAAPPEPATVAGGGYFVQVAAVSKEEDAAALVDALKRKQYPAFSANTPPDKLFHVQVGPYAEIKDAEAMRTKLVGDGYNPILKK